MQVVRLLNLFLAQSQKQVSLYLFDKWFIIFGGYLITDRLSVGYVDRIFACPVYILSLKPQNYCSKQILLKQWGIVWYVDLWYVGELSDDNYLDDYEAKNFIDIKLNISACITIAMICRCH